MMIELAFMNGQAFVWSADDWNELREKHRIVGHLVGMLACLPRQDVFLGLPQALLNEETRLLLDQGIARLVSFDSLTLVPSLERKQAFEDFRKSSHQEQVKYFEAERRKRISAMVDIIVEGKRRKLLGLPTKKARCKDIRGAASTNVMPPDANVSLPDRNALIKEELDKIVPIPPETALVHIETACSSEISRTPVDFIYPVTDSERLRNKVFADLWMKGYYLTDGQKFGGDFLVYPGDPLRFHAKFIVTCVSHNQEIPAVDMVSMVRLGTTVRKSSVLATVAEDQVVYQTFKWVP